MANPPAGSSLFNRGPLFQEPPSPPPVRCVGGSCKQKDAVDPTASDGGSTSPVNAKPPAGPSLLFGALAESGRIKQRKNGSYRMLLKGVESINWFTDRKEVCNEEGIGKKELPNQVPYFG